MCVRCVKGRDAGCTPGVVRASARVHLDTAEVEKLPEPVEQGNWYVSAVAALPAGRIAYGFGHVARILVYDPVAGKDAGQSLPEGWTADGFCINLLAGRSVLYASHFPSGRRAAFDTATGRFLGQMPWPDAISGQQWSKWIHSSGYGSGIDFLGQRVYRPYNTCVAEDGKIWSVGPAGWGTTGGGVGYADPVALRTQATALPEAPHDVVPLWGNRVLVCSGGLLRW